MTWLVEEGSGDNWRTKLVTESHEAAYRMTTVGNDRRRRAGDRYFRMSEVSEVSPAPAPVTAVPAHDGPPAGSVAPSQTGPGTATIRNSAEDLEGLYEVFAASEPHCPSCGQIVKHWAGCPEAS